MNAHSFLSGNFFIKLLVFRFTFCPKFSFSMGRRFWGKQVSVSSFNIEVNCASYKQERNKLGIRKSIIDDKTPVEIATENFENGTSGCIGDEINQKKLTFKTPGFFKQEQPKKNT